MWGFHPDDSLGDRITKFKLIISMRVSVGSCSGLMHTAHTNCSLIQKERGTVWSYRQHSQDCGAGDNVWPDERAQPPAEPY